MDGKKEEHTQITYANILTTVCHPIGTDFKLRMSLGLEVNNGISHSLPKIQREGEREKERGRGKTKQFLSLMFAFLLHHSSMHFYTACFVHLVMLARSLLQQFLPCSPHGL